MTHRGDTGSGLRGGLLSSHSTSLRPQGPLCLLSDGHGRRCCVSVPVPKLPAPSLGQNCTLHPWPCPPHSLRLSWKTLPLPGFLESLGTSQMQRVKGHHRATRPSQARLRPFVLSLGHLPQTALAGSLHTHQRIPAFQDPCCPSKVPFCSWNRRPGASFPSPSPCGRASGLQAGLGCVSCRAPDTGSCCSRRTPSTEEGRR